MKICLWLGFVLVFSSLQGLLYNPLDLEMLIAGNLIILIASYMQRNNELVLLTLLMCFAQITRIAM
jgi:hypothetical protein